MQVQEAIYANLANHTVLLIAHRLSTVERATRIVVINEGRVIEQGTHLELLSRGGMYKQLVQRQLMPGWFDAHTHTQSSHICSG
jgi:ABC-type multidrug transport system fused ATPase/permease subunit